MIKAIFFSFALLFFSITEAYSNSSCYNISNKDKKYMCLAKAKGKSSYCYNISNKDKKNMCLAIVKDKKSYCYNIRSADNKSLCLSNF